jgi:5-methyltetrahydropteroyltriglutamate--homocysteine methyltransferase
METIYRAEVIGSLLRPDYLNEGRAALEAGRIDAADFKRLEDRAVDEALALQERAGVDVVTDGEMRRMIFTEPLTGVLEGVAPVGRITLHWRRKEGEVWKEQQSEPPMFAVVDKIKRRRWLARDEFEYARTRTRRPLKVTLAAPTMAMNLWSPQHSIAAYPDLPALFADAVDLIRGEIRELAGLGCKYIQIDAPELTWIADEVRLQEMAGIHPKLPGWFRNEGLDALNAIAGGVPGVSFGLHMCRGNYQGYWLSEAPWERLAKLIFKRAGNYDIFLLEYDDWRSGSFEPLAQLPPGKVAVLGLISTKRSALEPRDEIIVRIEEASRFYPREQLALSAQCGFSPEPSAATLTPAQQEAKLGLVSQIARQVWK